jgi:hypothetical protein
MATPTGVFPEEEAGGVPIRNPDGTPTNNPDVQNAYAPPATYASSCVMTALPTDCTARIEARQINAIVSELVAFAECLDPDGPWVCENHNNLCTSFNVWLAAFSTYLDTRYVNVTGDTMTGALIVPAPVNPGDAANKQYVDDKIAAAEGLDENNFVNVIGDVMTGSLTIRMNSPQFILEKMSSAPGEGAIIWGRLANLGRWSIVMVNSTAETGVNNTGSNWDLFRYADNGGVIDSVLHFDRSNGNGSVKDPVAPQHIATKAYVDAAVAAVGGGGGTVVEAFPPGTVMIFAQAAAPTGWVKSLTHNDKALRIVSGTTGGAAGGTNAFSTVMAQTTTGNHSVTAGESGAGITINSSGSVYTYPSGGSGNISPYCADYWYPVGVLQAAGNVGYMVPYSIGGAISAANVYWGNNTLGGGSTNTSSTPHNHPVMMGIQYVDVILGVKS